MDKSLLSHFRTIGAIQSAISAATTLDEALKSGLRAIVENSSAEYAVIWYADKEGDDRLRPYYWIGPVDLTRCSHAVGEGSVGRVYQSNQAERCFDFTGNRDDETAHDFEG